MKPYRLMKKMLRGDLANVAFDDLIRLLLALGFREIQGRGSHRKFVREDIPGLVNLQPERGDAKLYQIRQIADLIRRYNLKLEEE